MWFANMNRQKYPSTIYVTIKPLSIPNSFRPGLRSALDGGIEQIREEYRQMQSELDE